MLSFKTSDVMTKAEFNGTPVMNPRDAGGFLKLEEARKGFFPRESRRNTVLLPAT